MNKLLVFVFYLCSVVYVFAQSEQKYSAVNPALFLYTTDDVYIKPLTKYNNGSNIIRPNPASYPWETYLEMACPILSETPVEICLYTSRAGWLIRLHLPLKWGLWSIQTIQTM